MNHSDTIATLIASDARLGNLIQQRGQSPLLQPPRPTELVPELAKAIISQQISPKAANTVYARLEQHYSQWIDAMPRLGYAYALLETPEDTLRQLGISRPKVRYLKDLAQRVIIGYPTVAELALLTDAEVIQTLTQIKGVGTWTAQMFLIFRLHRLDVFPLDDLGIRKGVQKLYNLPELPDKKTLNEIGLKWQPYRSLACWYLWRSLD